MYEPPHQDREPDKLRISQLTHVVLFCFVLTNLAPGTQSSDANNSLPRIPADA